MPRKKYRKFTLEQCSKGGQWSPHRDSDLHEVIAQFHADRKGHVIAEGVTYSADGKSHWRVQHSTAHAHQFDVLADGRRIARGNPRRLPTPWIRRRARVAREANTTYGATGMPRSPSDGLNS